MKKNHLFKHAVFICIIMTLGACGSDESAPPAVSAAFSSDNTTIFENQTIQFSDQSTGNPTGWQWTFEGGTPETSTEANPNVRYLRAGKYQVSLTVINGSSSYVITKEEYITVQDDLLDGLVAQYDLDGNGDDASGFGNHGTIVRNVTPVDNRFGTPNGAMTFSEFEGWIDMGDAPALKQTGDMSISVWVKTDGNLQSWEAIVNKWNGSRGYYLGINPEGTKLYWNIAEQIVEAPDPFPENTWTHIAGTLGDNRLKLYIDGVLVGELDNVQPTGEHQESFLIGQQSNLTNNVGGFNGAIDEVWIYNRGLKASEVEELASLK